MSNHYKFVTKHGKNLFNLISSDQAIEQTNKVSSRITKLCLIFSNPSFLINEHVKIQSLEKLQGCCTFGDYADVFLASVFNHFAHMKTQVYVTCDHYSGQQLIKLSTCIKRTAKMRKLIQRPEVPLPRGPQVRSCNISVSRTTTKKAKSLAGNGEVIARWGLSGSSSKLITRRQKYICF